MQNFAVPRKVKTSSSNDLNVDVKQVILKEMKKARKRLDFIRKGFRNLYKEFEHKDYLVIFTQEYLLSLENEVLNKELKGMKDYHNSVIYLINELQKFIVHKINSYEEDPSKKPLTQ